MKMLKKCFSEKKGIATETTVFMMLGLVIFIAISLTVILPLKETAEANSEKEACQKSVLMHSKLRIETKPISESIKCPTKFITIEETNATKIKQEIANQMFDCWDNFGEGKLELFDAQSEKFCVVCSVLNFKEKRILTGFTDFLATEKIPTRDITYLEYFTGQESANPQIAEQLEIAKQEIDTGKEYAVVFTYAKTAYWSNFGKAGLGAIIGIVGGVALSFTGIGAPVGLALIGGSIGTAIGGSLKTSPPEWNAAIVLIPEENITELECTSIPKTK